MHYYVNYIVFTFLIRIGIKFKLIYVNVCIINIILIVCLGMCYVYKMTNLYLLKKIRNCGGIIRGAEGLFIKVVSPKGCRTVALHSDLHIG